MHEINKKDLQTIVLESINKKEVISKIKEKFNINIRYNQLNKLFKKLNINIENLKVKSDNSSKILIKSNKKQTRTTLHYYLGIYKKYECEICNQKPYWNNKELVLHIDHINGDSKDHRLENLRYLCPNCHTQTETYGYKGKNYTPNGAKKKEGKSNKCLDCDKLIYKSSLRCMSCASFKQNKNSRKVLNRPKREDLIKEIEELGYSAVGRKYGVSDNAVRKWLKCSKYL